MRPGPDGTAKRHPKYYLVKGQLAEMLAELAPGEALPAERALAESFSTSRTTVRQALGELTVEGRLVRLQGRGTFAALPKVAQPLQLTSYTEDMRRQGLTSRSRLLSVTHMRADEDLACRLDVRRGARVLRVERLRLARWPAWVAFSGLASASEARPPAEAMGNDEPMAIETTHLEESRFPGLSKLLGDSVSLYALMAERYGVVLARAEETIETVPAAPREAELLEVAVGCPMLLLSRHSRDASGRPVEWVLSFYRGDRYKLVAQLMPPHPHVPPPVRSPQRERLRADRC